MLTVNDPVALRRTIDDHLAGRAVLTGLDLYYALERSTSLLSFHAMLRDGPRNRTREGLQQSYGDHNRLLMVALDRMLAGNADWLVARVASSGSIDDASLRRCVDAARALELTADVEVALWLGAALHDCGMLRGQGAHVDVEDGLVLARPILAEYCPDSTRALAEFALRHHDYVKDAFLGETPVGLLADDLRQIPSRQRPLGLVALGLIQVAGAASLGKGRLTDFRLHIFNSCINGVALKDRSSTLRLARLLAASPDPSPEAVPPPDIAAASAIIDTLTLGEVTGFEDFLDRVSVHGWHAFVADAPVPVRIAALRWVAAQTQEWRADHVVIAESLRAPDDGALPNEPASAIHTALSGRTVVTVLSGQVETR